MYQKLKSLEDIIYPETTSIFALDFCPEIIPPQILEIEINHVNFNFKTVLPKSLKKLIIYGCDIETSLLTDLINLEVLVCNNLFGDLNLLPKNLKFLKISIARIFKDNEYFPENLEELFIDLISFINFPPNLKNLRINFPTDLVKHKILPLNFPCSLEYLNLLTEDYQVLDFLPEGIKVLKITSYQREINQKKLTVFLPNSIEKLELIGKKEVNFILPKKLKSLIPFYNFGFEIDNLPISLESFKFDDNLVRNNFQNPILKKLAEKIKDLKNLKELFIPHNFNENIFLPLSLKKLYLPNHLKILNSQFPNLIKLVTNYPPNQVLLNPEIEELILEDKFDKNPHQVNLKFFTKDLVNLKYLSFTTFSFNVIIPPDNLILFSETKNSNYLIRIYQK